MVSDGAGGANGARSYISRRTCRRRTRTAGSSPCVHAPPTASNTIPLPGCGTGTVGPKLQQALRIAERLHGDAAFQAELGLAAKNMSGITIKLSSRKYSEKLEWVGAQGMNKSLDHLLGARVHNGRELPLYVFQARRGGWFKCG